MYLVSLSGQRSRYSGLCRLVAWHLQSLAYVSRVGRICPTSVTWASGRGRILRGESLPRRLGGAVRTPGLWLAWQFEVRERYSRYRSMSLFPQSFGHRLGIVWTRSVCSGLFLWGNGRAALASAGGSLRFAISCRAHASPGVCLVTVWLTRRHVEGASAQCSGSFHVSTRE